MKIDVLKKAKNIAIAGFGKEGRSTLKFLQSISCENITILDKNEVPEEYLDYYNCVCGDFYMDDLESFDVIIKSVGISPYQNKKLQKVQAKTTTATEIFFANYTGKIIGITGTKGKSTTSSLCHHVLKSLGYQVALLGNIGNPALDVLHKDYDYVIYELSSYMLENITPNLYVGVLINIFPDHLDWYNGDFSLYKKAKQNILEKAEIKIINHSLEQVISQKYIKNSIHYNERDKDINFHEGNFYIGDHAIFTHEGIHLEGEHNMENITCVLSILRAIGIEILDIKKILTNFCALPHRLQNLGVFKEIIFIDDAISTTPESTIQALKTYKNTVGTLFLGGTDRGYDFTELIAYLKNYDIKNIVLFPDSGAKIKGLLDASYNILETKSMRDAVAFAFTHTKKEEICLLSTASPSYSIWKNFEEKGTLFKKYIHEISSQDKS